MYITRLTPVYKDYIWGGNKLKKLYGKQSTFDKIAESWELSCHQNGQCIVRDGKYAGKTLAEALAIEENKSIDEIKDKFPIIIKLINSNEDLSIQVHPDNLTFNDKIITGKNEFWYILEADNNSKIAYGLKEKVNKNQFDELCKNGKIIDKLNFIPVKEGQSFFINAGLIHSIGKGITLIEIQQNSDLTYRLYDYNRQDKYGNYRPLHIKDALETAILSPTIYKDVERKQRNNSEIINLCNCPFFKIDKISSINQFNITSDKSFICITVLNGNGNIKEIPLQKGDTVYIPKNSIADITGNLTFIKVTPGEMSLFSDNFKMSNNC